MRKAVCTHLNTAPAIELKSHLAARADVLDIGKLTIGNLQFLIGCRELDAITDENAFSSAR